MKYRVHWPSQFKPDVQIERFFETYEAAVEFSLDALTEFEIDEVDAQAPQT